MDRARERPPTGSTSSMASCCGFARAIRARPGQQNLSAARSLGGHVSHLAQQLAWASDLLREGSFQRLREHQVTELGDLVAGTKQDVGRRDVAMDDLMAGGEVERACDVDRHAQTLTPV